MKRDLCFVADIVLSTIRDKFYNPVLELFVNFSNQLKRRDPIVTQEELVQDHIALSRMLEEFSARKNKSLQSSLPNKIKDSVLGQEKLDSASLDRDTGSISYSSPPLESQPRTLENKLMTSGQIKAMEQLMRSYELELMNPLRGLLFGDLVTAILIQVN
jgi:hypothetical protein